MSLFSPGLRVHFVGIGGVAMSAMARLLAARGCLVSGSDREMSEALRDLGAEGIPARAGHSAEAVRGADLVIATAALRPDNPEVVEARRLGIPVIGRAEALGRMMEGKRGVAVSGTHGKTTTTALTALTLVRAGLDPTVMVGGHVPEIGGNARAGAGPHFVAEADEFDRSFLWLRPHAAVVTAVEEEHLDCYRDLSDIRETFLQFIGHVSEGGLVVLCLDGPNVRALRSRVAPRVVTCGLAPDADISAAGVSLKPDGSAFTLTRKGAALGQVRLRLPGLHNVQNALAASAVALELGVEAAPLREALESFGGVGRRFEALGEKNGVLVVDDYAHHPTKVTATLAAARTLGRRRVVVAFQPHLYSRTRDFAPGFGSALAAADLVLVTDVYAAREAPIEGVTGALIAEAARRAGAREVAYVPDRGAVAEVLAGRVRPGDLVIVMGAGDIRSAGEELLKRL
jgi:UDP-N-acetylmuramate--alanine ligase